VIWNFADQETAKLFARESIRKLPPEILCTALRKLIMLDAATIIQELLVPPSNRLEKLFGDREGQYSIRINDQWRICFKWKDGDAFDVEIVDYH
jgi:proteic killer suppression protein